MKDNDNDLLNNEIMINAINSITAKLSDELLQEFLNLPNEAQKNLVLLKIVQLLLANVLCQIAIDIEELELLAANQSSELNELILNCAATGYAKKFGLVNH